MCSMSMSQDVQYENAGKLVGKFNEPHVGASLRVQLFRHTLAINIPLGLSTFYINKLIDVQSHTLSHLQQSTIFKYFLGGLLQHLPGLEDDPTMRTTHRDGLPRGQCHVLPRVFDDQLGGYLTAVSQVNEACGIASSCATQASV